MIQQKPRSTSVRASIVLSCIALLATGMMYAGCYTSSLSRARHSAYNQHTGADESLHRKAEHTDIPLIPGEELWIIQKPEQEAVNPPSTDQAPRSGAMIAQVDGKRIPVPVKHTDVNAQINAFIATVDVTQQFHNPFEDTIEAAYVFPLPTNAAINEFVMTIGTRRIRGIIREKEQAQQIYQAAKSAGHTASLMTQQRPNIFTQQVANIEPGKQINVNIRYFNTLAYENGWYKFVFPTVVGPRFNPPHTTDGIGAYRYGSSPTNQPTQLAYLNPDQRSGHDIDITLSINAGVKIERIVSANHKITETRQPDGRVRLQLAPADRIANRDFVVRFQVAGERMKSDILISQPDDKGDGWFTLMLYPPQSTENLVRAPMEMVFVIDCSGSMHGAPMRQAKNAINAALDHMNTGDTFQIITFSDHASQFGNAPIPATPENLHNAKTYVRSLNANGGTMMLNGINAALNFPHDPNRIRYVVFLTDGYIGNESEILNAITRQIGQTRIFSFGIGSSTNRYLMDRMAQIGNGSAAYLGLQDDARQVMTRFWDRVSHPILSHIRIDWGQLKVNSVYPTRIPDLIAGRPVILCGQYQSTDTPMQNHSINIHGRIGGKPVSFDVQINAESDPSVSTALAGVWARSKIADLYIRLTLSQDHAEELLNAIKQTALDYQLLSDYTAFVAVDTAHRLEQPGTKTVDQPVAIPQGVNRQTAIGPENKPSLTNTPGSSHTDPTPKAKPSTVNALKPDPHHPTPERTSPVSVQ